MRGSVYASLHFDLNQLGLPVVFLCAVSKGPRDSNQFRIFHPGIEMMWSPQIHFSSVQGLLNSPFFLIKTAFLFSPYFSPFYFILEHSWCGDSFNWTAKWFNYTYTCTWASSVAQIVKKSSQNVGDPDSILVLGRSPRGRHGNPLQYFCLKNPHGQRSLAGGVTKSWTWLSD